MGRRRATPTRGVEEVDYQSHPLPKDPLTSIFGEEIITIQGSSGQRFRKGWKRRHRGRTYEILEEAVVGPGETSVEVKVRRIP